MGKSMILYDLNDKTPAEKTSILRELYGYNDKSCNGRYNYQRPGLVSGIVHQRKTKTALIVADKDAEDVVKILKKLGIKPALTKLKS